MNKNRHVLGVLGTVPDDTHAVNINCIHPDKASTQALRYRRVTPIFEVDSKRQQQKKLQNRAEAC